MSALLLTLRTARHLRIRQIAARIKRNAFGHARPRRVDAAWHDERARTICNALCALGPVNDADATRRSAAAWRTGTVELLGRTQPMPVTWREPFATPLLEYHLHYHDVLADAAWASFADSDPSPREGIRDSVHTWRSAWRGGDGPAWDPYPISVRAVNWVRMIGWGALDATDAELQASLATQIDLLSRDLEWHLGGNHLLRDAWALAIVPGCFSGAWADATWRAGRQLFFEQMLEQVNADGVHEERSPMYQARVLRDAIEVLAVLDAVNEPVPPAVRARVAQSAAALQWMRHSNGALRLINDAAGDHGVDLSRAVDDAAKVAGYTPEPPGFSRTALAGDFVAVRDTARGHALLVDLGAPAPPHQPAHSHAGALSFELDIDGRPLVIDGGCSGYAGDPWRGYFRSTAAHNTTVINGRDQSEMWGVFRVARRAQVSAERVSAQGTSVEIRARCRPYHRLAACHERVWRYDAPQLAITDVVRDAKGCNVESYLHFDAAWSATRESDTTVVLTQDSARAVLRYEGSLALSLHRGETGPKRGWQAEGFNRVVPCWTVRLSSPKYDGSEWRVTLGPA